MPTIAEIIAAKKAALPPAPPGLEHHPDPKSTAGKRTETLTDRLETAAAINRIDPPGKYQARVAAGLILSEQPANRSLSQATGEGIDITPTAADAEVTTWHQSLNAYESDLVVMRDPATPEACWLACRPRRVGLPPILLHRLPWLMFEHPDQQSVPF